MQSPLSLIVWLLLYKEFREMIQTCLPMDKRQRQCLQRPVITGVCPSKAFYDFLLGSDKIIAAFFERWRISKGVGSFGKLPSTLSASTLFLPASTLFLPASTLFLSAATLFLPASILIHYSFLWFYLFFCFSLSFCLSFSLFQWIQACLLRMFTNRLTPQADCCDQTHLW